MSKKGLLLFPPVADLTQPYLSLPSLTAFLKNNNIKITQRDLNIEFYDRVLSSDYLIKIFDCIKKRFYYLDSKDNLNQIEWLEYKNLSISILDAKFSIENINKAKSVFKSQDFYNEDKYIWARDIIRRTLFIFSCKYFPSSLTIDNFYSRFYYHKKNELFKIINNKKENPFIEFIESFVIPFIKKNNFQIIGISLSFFCQMVAGFTLAKLIKEYFPYIHITVGGNVVTQLSETFSKEIDFFSILDSFILYEGEKPLLELFYNLDNLNNVPNLIYKSRNEIKKTRITTPLDINSLPTPDFTGLPWKKYLSPHPIIPILTSRGCYWGKCSFCYQHRVTYYNKFRMRKYGILKEDIIKLSKKYNTKYFYFCDSAVPPKIIKNLAFFSRKKEINISWTGYARIEKFFEDLKFCKQLKQSGCTSLQLGFESASNRILSLMRKGITVETIEKAIKNLTKVNIITYLIYFVGFPGETKKEVYKTLSFIKRNKNYIECIASSGTFALEKDSDIFLKPENYGITEIKEIAPLYNRYEYKVNKGITIEQAQEIVSKFHQDKTILELTFKIPYALHRTHLVFYKKKNNKKFEKLEDIIDKKDKILILNPNSNLFIYNYNWLNSSNDSENIIKKQPIIILSGYYNSILLNQLLKKILHLIKYPLTIPDILNILSPLRFNLSQSKKEFEKNVLSLINILITTEILLFKNHEKYKIKPLKFLKKVIKENLFEKCSQAPIIQFCRFPEFQHNIIIPMY